MSEGSPADRPPEADQTRHIPVDGDPGSPGSEAAPPEDTNPLAPNVSGDNYVEDPAKAETMAYAEDNFRTKAVQNRDLVREAPELSERRAAIEEEAKQVDAATSDPSRRLGRKERRSLKQRNSQNNQDLLGLMRDESDDRDRRELDERSRASQFKKDFPEREDEAYNFDINARSDPQVRAHFYDERAARIGEWAGLLHDRPLSDEFKKNHPGVQFQPARLMRMEDEVEALERKIERGEGARPPENMQSAVREVITRGGEQYGERVPEVQRLLARASDEGLDTEYEKLTGQLMDSATALDKLHARLVDEVDVQPLRDRIAMTRNLLNDVRREVGLPTEGEPDKPAE